MNRLLFLLCCICVPWMARGQAAYEWLYWFDMNHASRVSGQSIGDSFTITTDADGLSEGIHTIHVQVADTAGKYSPPLGQLFYYSSGRAVKRLYYWFDNEVALTQTVPVPLNDLSIDVSGLEPGLHFIYCQVEDAAGILSDVMCRAFYRRPVKSALKWTYWFDEDEDSCVTVPFPGEVTMIDVSHLQEGFHVLHNQVYDATASDITTTMFIKVPQTEGVGDMTCICTVDDKLVAKETLPTSGGILKWVMDVDNMDVGIHKAMFQVITPSGAASSIAERYFVRAITNKEMGSMKCVYTIDNFQTQHQAGTLSDGLFHFDLDVSSIENGLHRIAYTLVSETGVTLPQKTAFFWKTPLGGDGIVQYNYWLNDRDDQQHVVRLDKRTNPFSLIALLPVETQPIRSSNFQFAIKNGEPLIYARNEFHIQFFDTNGRMVEETKEYYDEQVNTPVKPVGELQATQTFDKVAENDIRWYTMQVAPGDTAAFKLSQPATVQVFAPSGEEVFKTSESASVKWSGIHTWEEGTYYLAVHDVTGSKEDMTLEYMHMDKYDVVDWDVHRVGNGGCSTITFKGNGFRDLYAVDLVIAPGDTIHSVVVSHDSDAETAVTFDFIAATLGEYKAVFHFEEGELTIEKCVTVEEATPIELDVEADFGQQYLLAFHKTKYVFSIHNYGNVTAYNVPLMIRIYTHTGESLERVDIDGYDLGNGFIEYWGLNYNDTITDFVKNLKKESGDRYFFVEADSTDIVAGWAAHVHETFVQPNIPPNSTIDISVNMLLGQAVYCYMWCPEDWDDDNNTINNRRRTATNQPCKKTKFVHWLRCYKRRNWYEKLEAKIKTYGSFDDAFALMEDEPHTDEDCSDKPRKIQCGPLGGISRPIGSHDPNDIFGYLSGAESKFMTDSVAKVTYTIEFENDTTFATAAAHEIFIADTLDAAKFDLSTFAPSQINIGNRSIELNGEKNFIKTVDMRPEINAIAQVEGTFNEKKGIAKWHISSLDPMTMEHTEDVMQGILPVNHDGTSGIGMVMFNIGLKQPLSDGTEVPNRANIIFDKNEAILTPTWTNIVDAVAPTSIVDGLTLLNDSTLRVFADAEDARSGVWKYEWYVQHGENAPWWKEGETESPQFDYHIFEGIDYGFCVLATDSAGNVEQKVIQRERGFKTYGQDFEDRIDEANGQSSMVNGQSIYDLSGRRQAVPKENQVNIIDKKKVLIR